MNWFSTDSNNRVFFQADHSSMLTLCEHYKTEIQHPSAINPNIIL